MSWLFRIVAQRAIAKGSARFAALSVAIGVLRLLRKATGTGPHVMYKRELAPGEVLVVSEPKQPRR
jgi:hypothetical protein